MKDSISEKAVKIILKTLSQIQKKTKFDSSFYFHDLNAPNFCKHENSYLKMLSNKRKFHLICFRVEFHETRNQMVS
jgi:hypothetical protein